MAPEDALKRLSDDDWYAQLQSGLTRVAELIDDAKLRIAEHAAHMATLEGAPELYGVSRALQPASTRPSGAGASVRRA
jgi:hypothetical protein